MPRTFLNFLLECIKRVTGGSKLGTIFLICVVVVCSVQVSVADSNIPINSTTDTNQDFTNVQDEYDYSDSGEKNGTSWRERNWRRQDNSRIAQVVVYFSVILIALGGILIKYFVTQFETSQIKAQEQLNYQRLQNA